MKDYLSNLLPRVEWPEQITLSGASFTEMQRALDRDALKRGDPIAPPSYFAGIAIQSSSALPVDRPCRTCHGSGEGAASTYCADCNGHGGDRVIGFVSGAKPTFIVEPLHAKIPPRFPAGLVPFPRLARGLA